MRNYWNRDCECPSLQSFGRVALIRESMTRETETQVRERAKVEGILVTDEHDKENTERNDIGNARNGTTSGPIATRARQSAESPAGGPKSRMHAAKSESINGNNALHSLTTSWTTRSGLPRRASARFLLSTSWSTSWCTPVLLCSPRSRNRPSSSGSQLTPQTCISADFDLSCTTSASTIYVQLRLCDVSVELYVQLYIHIYAFGLNAARYERRCTIYKFYKRTKERFFCY